MSRQSRLLLLLLILFAVALRTRGLFANTFHSDEALFATWSRLIATLQDPLLRGQIIDKPPLLFYAQAAFYPLLGPVMWAARLPNFVASILLIPLVSVFAWRLYRDEATVILAAGFLVFSPMAIQFSASGFLDPLMTCLVFASLALIAGYQGGRSEKVGDGQSDSSGRAQVWAGIMFGLAVSVKYQAWLFLPLLLGLTLANGWRKADWLKWLKGFLPVMGLLLAWAAWRGGELAIVQRQIESYGGFRLAWSWELWSRLETWAGQWSLVLESPVLEFLLLLALPPFIALLIDQRDRAAEIDRMLVVFLVAYFLLHWFVAVPTWDRYVLPVLPLVGLVLARFVWRVASYVWPWAAEFVAVPIKMKHLVFLIPIVLLVFQATSVADAYRGRLPVGARPQADQGAAKISDALADAPYGTVLYDHWYSWQWRYHLLDKRVYISWFPDPDALVEDLQVFAGDGDLRYLALPDSIEALPVIRTLKTAGFQLEPETKASGQDGKPGIVLYEVRQR